MKLDYRRVLIADDEPDHCLIIRLLLSKLWLPELSFIEADTGKEAIFLTQYWQPDLILINLKMPDIDGCEIIRQMRSLKANPMSAGDDISSSDAAWIVAMSTNVRKLERDRALAAGCDAFLRKPFWLDDLFAQLPTTTIPPFSSNPNREVICHAAA
jgi:CheY-like chemotaxis protein